VVGPVLLCIMRLYMIIISDSFVRIWKENVLIDFEALSQHVPGASEVNHKHMVQKNWSSIID